MARVATFRRLLGFLRPYRRGVVLSRACWPRWRWSPTVAIPWLTGRAIDQMRARRPRRRSSALAVAVAAAGVLRLALTVARRLVAGRVSLGVELDLRQRLYGAPAGARARVLRPPADRPAHVARDGRPAVRALLPRLRAVFMMQSALTILLAAVAMFVDRPAAGGDLAAAGAVRRARRRALRAPRAAGAAGGPAADRRADRRGRGEHLRRARRQGVRARGPPARALQRARRAASSTRRWSRTRLQAFYNPFIGFLPQLGLAAILFFGGRQVIDG